MSNYPTLTSGCRGIACRRHRQGFRGSVAASDGCEHQWWAAAALGDVHGVPIPGVIRHQASRARSVPLYTRGRAVAGCWASSVCSDCDRRPRDRSVSPTPLRPNLIPTHQIPLSLMMPDQEEIVAGEVIWRTMRPGSTPPCWSRIRLSAQAYQTTQVSELPPPVRGQQRVPRQDQRPEVFRDVTRRTIW